MKSLLLLTISFFLGTLGYAQKIKYKDLFFVLDTKNYKDGEPLLRKFLADPKNLDEPNANFQFALLLDKKARESDVILEYQKVVTYADSALIYYRKSLTLMDEKEVAKKNKDYYQAYQRRDVRTGKFGIKLADVTFDIQNKIKSLEERKANVQELNLYYTKTNDNYNFALQTFKEIKEKYPTEKVLYLRANDDLDSRLDELSKAAELALQNYQSFESTLDKIEKSGYGPALHKSEIANYQEDGLTEIKLTDDNIYFYDYELWVTAVKDGIAENIEPMRLELVEYDQSLNALLERIKTDSMAMDDRMKSWTGTLTKVKKYDDNPLPEVLFEFKRSKVSLESLKMKHLYYRDSSDILYQKEIASNKNKLVQKMDSLVNLLISRDPSEDNQNYNYFIKEQYDNIDGLQIYYKSQLDEVIKMKQNSDDEISKLVERSKWLISEADSIPIFEEVNIGLSKYAPIIITDELTAGLYFSGESAAQGYFSVIDPTLSQKLRENFPIDNKNFNKQNLETTNALATKEASGHYYLVLFYYPIPEQEEYAATIAKIYTSDGLAWSKNHQLETAPFELLINENTGDIIIEYDLENYLGEKAIQDRLVLTKKGVKK